MLTRTLIAALLALLTNTAHAESMAVSINTSPLWSGAELTTRLTDTVNAS
jgi:hypothetical protein